MKDGIGYVGAVSFTDNSSWIRSRKFRIGVRTLPGTAKLKIKEARSEAVVVKDQRGESYKKHHPPYAGDEVWRLEKIAKDGKFHKQLAIKGITTVKDFLRLYATDPFALRGVFGGKVTKKTWEIITEHAGKCILDDNKLYCYSATERVGLVLNSVYKVVGATFDGTDFQSLDKLTAPQIQLVEVLKSRAYANLNDWFPVDEQITAGFSRRWLDLPTDSPSNSSLDLQQGNFPVEHQDELEMQLSFNNVTTPSFTFEVGENSQFQFPKAHNSHLASSNSLVDGGNSWPSSGALMPVVQAGSMLADDTYRALMSTWLPVTPEWGQGNEFFSTPCSDEGVGMVSSFPNFAIHISQNRRPKVAWCKLRAAVKWGMLARRHVTA